MFHERFVHRRHNYFRSLNVRQVRAKTCLVQLYRRMCQVVEHVRDRQGQSLKAWLWLRKAAIQKWLVTHRGKQRDPKDTVKLPVPGAYAAAG